jgi:hypothetical protein
MPGHAIDRLTINVMAQRGLGVSIIHSYFSVSRKRKGK